MPISLERKHDNDLDWFFFSFYWIFSSSKQSVLMLIMPRYLFFQCYIELFSLAIYISLENGYIYFPGMGGGWSTNGEKLLYNIGRLVYKKSFYVTLDQWIKESHTNILKCFYQTHLQQISVRFHSQQISSLATLSINIPWKLIQYQAYNSLIIACFDLWEKR